MLTHLDATYGLEWKSDAIALGDEYSLNDCVRLPVAVALLALQGVSGAGGDNLSAAFTCQHPSAFVNICQHASA